MWSFGGPQAVVIANIFSHPIQELMCSQYGNMALKAEL